MKNCKTDKKLVLTFSDNTRQKDSCNIWRDDMMEGKENLYTQGKKKRYLMSSPPDDITILDHEA